MAKKLNICNEKHPEMLENTPQHPPQPLAIYHNPTLLKKITPTDLCIKTNVISDTCILSSPKTLQNMPECSYLFPETSNIPASSLPMVFFPKRFPNDPQSPPHHQMLPNQLSSCPQHVSIGLMTQRA